MCVSFSFFYHRLSPSYNNLFLLSDLPTLMTDTSKPQPIQSEFLSDEWSKMQEGSCSSPAQTVSIIFTFRTQIKIYYLCLQSSSHQLPPTSPPIKYSILLLTLSTLIKLTPSEFFLPKYLYICHFLLEWFSILLIKYYLHLKF